MDVREYRYYRTRWGLAGSSDYKLGNDSNVYARFLYSDFQNYGDRWVYSLNDNTQNAGLPRIQRRQRLRLTPKIVTFHDFRCYRQPRRRWQARAHQHLVFLGRFGFPFT